jgi:hypothetical protein
VDEEEVLRSESPSLIGSLLEAQERRAQVARHVRGSLIVLGTGVTDGRIDWPMARRQTRTWGVVRFARVLSYLLYLRYLPDG